LICRRSQILWRSSGYPESTVKTSIHG
jgi:hypothetical protein